MNDYHSLSHTTWDCKYHLVWIPKYRKKGIYGDIRRYLGEALRGRGTSVTYGLSSNRSMSSGCNPCRPRPIDLLTADGLLSSLARNAQVSPRLRLRKISVPSIPRMMTWWSAPGASMRDSRGIHPFRHNKRRMSIFQGCPLSWSCC